MTTDAFGGRGGLPGTVLISVVTVTFKDDAGLRRTLESLSHLGDIQSEVIVVDGASLPSTKGLVRSIAPGATIVQEPDHGPYDAMNKGALLAKGHWIWFLNAGDTVAASATPEMIERLVSSAEDVVVVARALTPSGDLWPSDAKATLAGYLAPCHQAMLTPRSLLPRPVFDRRFQIAADYDTFLATSARSGVHFSDDAICTYEGGGISSRRRLRLESELLLIRLRHGLEPLRRLPGDLLRVPWRAFRSWQHYRRDAA